MMEASWGHIREREDSMMTKMVGLSNWKDFIRRIKVDIYLNREGKGTESLRDEKGKEIRSSLIDIHI